MREWWQHECERREQKRGEYDFEIFLVPREKVVRDAGRGRSIQSKVSLTQMGRDAQEAVGYLASSQPKEDLRGTGKKQLLKWRRWMHLQGRA